MQEQEQITTLPGVFATIAAGFDLTAKHIWLLALRVILDVFYWLGPRLRFQDLITEILALLPQEADLLDIGSQLAQVAPRTNLFTTLTVQLIGVPALMVGLVPEKTPISPQVLDVTTWSGWIGLFALFSIIGLLLTAIFYTLMAFALNKQTPDGEILSSDQWAKRVGTSWIRFIGLVLFFLLIVFIIYILILTVYCGLELPLEDLINMTDVRIPLKDLQVILNLKITPAI